MSTGGEPASSSRLPFHKTTPYTSTPQPNMFDYPAELNNAQLEAKRILAHLLETLKDKDSKYYAKYGKWVERHHRLEEFCFRCIRPQIWTFLNGRWSLDSLKWIGGDLKYEGRGVYLDGVLSLDKKVRVYIGQAGQVRARIAQHLNFRYRRDNPSLHYHAMQQSIYNSIGLAALIPSPNMGNQALPGMDSPDLLLNVLEMWMCLVFRTLPKQMLEEWLPNDGTINKNRKEGQEGEFGGLNIACPLDHGEKQREWLDLSESDDPLIRDYLGLGRKIGEGELRKRSDIQYVKAEDKKDGDSNAQKKVAYTELARSYNKDRRQQDNNASQAAGYMLAIAMAGLIVTALVKGSGGPRGR
ncbi:hypothetical protein CC86DRAFT_365096 [Ophiobolus disseminans]|uniref:Uncharacterized protein n=1 Tax=Ophiobolus disseminans TaxID=1469910 RepID=A0A6A7AIL8_9PLEO|nr:hypothetical protein CC86DRAFT_365096 [Ophiobolus disseminans]